MSFATFSPLPKPQPNPIPGLLALAGASRPSPSNPLSTRGEGRGEVSSTAAGGTGGSALWLVVAALLARIDPDVRYYVQRLFERALEAVENDLALPPERRRLVPVPYLVQHLARPRFQRIRLREQDQRGIDNLLLQALWRAVDALEAAALVPERAIYLSLLAEQCNQFSLVYEVLQKRAGRCAALWIAQGDLRLLRHRGSRAAEQLLFG